MLRRADLHESNHQLESRVREIRLPGSEGGAILISRPYPYPAQEGCQFDARRVWNYHRSTSRP
jgi:hypothetical protein